MERHPDLKIKKTSTLEECRAHSLNQTVVNQFFDLLEELIEVHRSLSGACQIADPCISTLSWKTYTTQMRRGYNLVLGRASVRLWTELRRTYNRWRMETARWLPLLRQSALMVWHCAHL